MTKDRFAISRTEFTVEKTSVVTSKVSVDISATYNGTRQTAVLTVMPRISSTLSLERASVMGGFHSIGTLLLEKPAPKGGAVVSLMSSDTGAASLPSIVIVAARATTAMFPIRTNPVANDVLVAITASHDVIDTKAELLVQSVPLQSVKIEERLKNKFLKEVQKLLFGQLRRDLRLVLEKKADARPATLHDLEQVATWGSLKTLCCEVGDPLASASAQFLETADHLAWAEARLDAYEAEIVPAGSIAWGMCTILYEHFGIGKDAGLRVLEGRLHEAMDEAKMHIVLRPVPPTGYRSAPGASRVVARLSEFEKVVGKLMGDARNRYPGTKLPIIEIQRIAADVDRDGRFPLSKYLERGAKQKLVDHNKRYRKTALKTWSAAAKHPLFHPFVRRRFNHAEDKFRLLPC